METKKHTKRKRERKTNRHKESQIPVEETIGFKIGPTIYTKDKQTNTRNVKQITSATEFCTLRANNRSLLTFSFVGENSLYAKL